MNGGQFNPPPFSSGWVRSLFDFWLLLHRLLFFNSFSGFDLFLFPFLLRNTARLVGRAVTYDCMAAS